MNLIEMWNQMGLVAKGVACVLFFMSMWSFGVAIERIFTFPQARKQSKLYAPQVAKHLKEGRLKDAIALSAVEELPLQPPGEGRARRPAGVPVPAGERRRGLSREDMLDTVRRAIQRASALTASDLKKGVAALATIGSTAPFVGLLGTVVGVITRSRASRPPARAVSAPCRPVSRKRSSRPRSGSSSPSRRCGSTTT